MTSLKIKRWLLAAILTSMSTEFLYGVSTEVLCGVSTELLPGRPCRCTADTPTPLALACPRGAAGLGSAGVCPLKITRWLLAAILSRAGVWLDAGVRAQTFGKDTRGGTT